ncbi:MAG TPA: GntR family transcriptional regulator [Pseudonocardiaceae bacterium]|jgi:GntR family transcriptional regulator
MTAAPIESGPVRRTRADRARQVADVLRQQVVHGAFPDGVLPEERLLVGEFGVSRNTVREALDVLREEGLIDRLPGVGTVVRNEKFAHGIDRLRGLNETLCGHGAVSNEVRTAGLVRPPATVARRLRVPDGESVVYVERLRSLGGLPLSLDLTYLLREVGEPLLTEDLAGTDVFTLIERDTGQGLGAAQLQLEAVNADAHSAALLAVPKGAALLVMERLTHLDDGRPVDLEYIRFRGDRLIMSAELIRQQVRP